MQILLLGGKLFRWNVSVDVGRGAPNKPDDVELVRFGYACARTNPGVTFRLQMMDTLMMMQSRGGYGPDLQAVIDGHQKIRGGTQDGKVSVERGNSGESYDGGKHGWIISALNNSMEDIAEDVYPRIDKHPLCGTSAAATVKALLLPTK